MRILIIDDEIISRKVLMNKMKHIGRCTSVGDGLIGLALFDKAMKSNKAFDLITLDVSMPKMDGRQLLQIIRKKEKKLQIKKKDRVKIIMVTSRMNMSTIKECIQLGCDGYITKPVNKLQIMENLSRMGFTQPSPPEPDNQKAYSQIVAEVIQRFYKDQIKLPVLPHLVKEVTDLMESGDATIDDMVKIIKKDILISSKLISVANSPLYRGVEKADSLNAALVRMGAKASHELISALVTRDLFKSDHKLLNQLMEKLWMHSLACACFGKRIAQELELPNAESVFLMGIVHDIGKMLLVKAIMDMDTEESFETNDMQVALHEIHTTFGAVVLKKMRFAKEFVRIAEFHHWNDFSMEDDRELLIINLADYLANETGFGFFYIKEDEKEKFTDLGSLSSLKQLNLDKDKIIKMTDEVVSVIQESAPVF